MEEFLRKSLNLVLILLAVVATVVLPSCSRNRTVEPVLINPAFLNLTKEEVFGQGEKLLEQRKFAAAREHFAHVYENFPNDPLGRRSLLAIADTYFQQGGEINLIEAQYKYRDFLNRYPGSEMADYATLQIALVAHKQMERPDRDQEKTFEAAAKLRDMIALYPNSSYRALAEEKLAEANDRLAEHEHIVARFYISRRSWNAAVERLNGLIDNYPTYTRRDEVFYDLAEALTGLGRTGEARLYLERVLSEFPDSDLAEDARRKLAELTT